MSMSATEVSTAPAERVEELLALYGDPELCVADVLCDRHPAASRAHTVVEPDLSTTLLTYGELKESSERFAAGLADMGVRPGDRVATLLGKSVQQLIALMGIWRLGAVQVPLFTAFASPAIAMRLQASEATVVVCDDTHREKLPRANGIPGDALRHVIVVGTPREQSDMSFTELLTAHEPGFAAARLGPEAPLVHMFTSGTTGCPKGVVVPAAALASFHAYMEFGLNVQPEDVYWNAADPGWAYGLYYAIIGTFCTGVPGVLLKGGFSAELTYAVLSKLKVTNFAAAPTVYRALRASGLAVPENLVVRAASSAGEPLTPEVNEWAERALGVKVRDHYGQTEAGMLINNHHHPALQRSLKAGSMGQSMPGWTAAVLHTDRDELATAAGTLGRIAVDLASSPLAWFTGYLNEPAKSAEKFTTDQRWYLTGDSGQVDNDGYFRFMSRDDDVIIMAGYRIGPFDVESVLLTHPAVMEAAVVAAPDELRGEVLEAYVVLNGTYAASTELAEELQRLVKTQFAAHAYPRVVHFVSELPKTPSGKIQRYVLRQQRHAKHAHHSQPTHSTPSRY